MQLKIKANKSGLKRMNWFVHLFLAFCAIPFFWDCFFFAWIRRSLDALVLFVGTLFFGLRFNTINFLRSRSRAICLLRS